MDSKYYLDTLRHNKSSLPDINIIFQGVFSLSIIYQPFPFFYSLQFKISLSPGVKRKYAIVLFSEDMSWQRGIVFCFNFPRVIQIS